ncbi:hypothetical protein BH23THE1_BH23THE1_20710 [soil metagenome]
MKKGIQSIHLITIGKPCKMIAIDLLMRKKLIFSAVLYYIMTLRIKCKQCGFDHISNIYRLEEHNFHKKFSNLESCPRCGHVSKCDESDYKI